MTLKLCISEKILKSISHHISAVVLKKVGIITPKTNNPKISIIYYKIWVALGMLDTVETGSYQQSETVLHAKTLIGTVKGPGLASYGVLFIMVNVLDNCLTCYLASCILIAQYVTNSNIIHTV